MTVFNTLFIVDFNVCSVQQRLVVIPNLFFLNLFNFFVKLLKNEALVTLDSTIVNSRRLIRFGFSFSHRTACPPLISNFSTIFWKDHLPFL
uniref:Uncharacterized protein n=1 Tax=Panagrolaimus sp. JU765 TaxID=591449 RepID=A0AC34R0M2_9BILA